MSALEQALAGPAIEVVAKAARRRGHLQLETDQWASALSFPRSSSPLAPHPRVPVGTAGRNVS